jgi:hypothetical protein
MNKGVFEMAETPFFILKIYYELSGNVSQF